jgi:drug/metabolite transporter (DMT)-like permease
MMMRWLLVLLVAALTTATEVLRALGMRHHGEIHDFRPTAIGRALSSLVRNRYIIGSVCCSAVSFFVFLKLIAVADLSFAVPATAGSFVLETILAKYVLKERISRARWAGALMVACGVALLSA